MARRRRSSWQAFPPPSKPRPVEGGLKARSTRGAIGQTWWSQRFVEVLESFGMGPRLARGRTYARKGQVTSLDVAAGQVTALVQGSRARPYRVLIGVAELSAADWDAAEAELADRAIFLAKLLAGEMPTDVEAAFAACDLSLFPASPEDLDTACSCPDWANPCKHVAAVYYLLAEAFDDDPFLIFAWRGRGKDELLANLRARRGGQQPKAPAPDDDTWPAVATPPLDDCVEAFWDLAGDLPEMHLRPAAVADALLRQLDPAEVTVRGVPIDELLTPAYRALAGAPRRAGEGASLSGGRGQGRRTGP
ncbi:MAG TPA: SWIM zinc finger family protein [Egibacteraceae bacterium]|nr:SWIM zinc finger family protein [Egibacteraceae bacterium]